MRGIRETVGGLVQLSTRSLLPRGAHNFSVATNLVRLVVSSATGVALASPNPASWWWWAFLFSSRVGVTHDSISCDECKQTALKGIRWKCFSCVNYDLCHNCYMAGKHNMNHQFMRIDTPSSQR